jgi:hypothetical protein
LAAREDVCAARAVPWISARLAMDGQRIND